MTKKIALKAGDEVIGTAGRVEGYRGTVVRVDEDGDALVNFESGFYGWPDSEEHKNCWYLELDDKVKLVTPKPKKSSQDYKGNGKHKWEEVAYYIDDDSVDEDYEPFEELVERLRVPGGWLYRDSVMSTMTFVPMPAVVSHKV